MDQNLDADIEIKKLFNVGSYSTPLALCRMKKTIIPAPRELIQEKVILPIRCFA